VHDGDVLPAAFLQQLADVSFGEPRIARFNRQKNPSLVARLNRSQLNMG
jgi:hypothetical protein